MAEIGIHVPQQMIEDLVRAAVVRELGGQRELIEGIVNAALTMKKDNYSNKTLFQETVTTMIQKVAKEAVNEWVDSNRDRIKEAFKKHLSSRDGLAMKKLVDGLVDGVGRYNVNVSFSWNDLR